MYIEDSHVFSHVIALISTLLLLLTERPDRLRTNRAPQVRRAALIRLHTSVPNERAGDRAPWWDAGCYVRHTFRSHNLFMDRLIWPLQGHHHEMWSSRRVAGAALIRARCPCNLRP